MRRSKTGSADKKRAETTPPRTAIPAAVAVSTQAASGSSSRLAPRNWRVPTRLYAILLLPVLVGLVMGGFQVKESTDTWRQARDAERTARVVSAASDYGQALLNERDLTAQPLLEGKRSDPVIAASYAATDTAKKKFDTAVRSMPHTARLERRLSLFRAQEPKLAQLRKLAYTKAVETPDKNDGHGGPVATEEGYVEIQHSLMEFSNELGFGTTNITAYGRTLYSVQLAKAAESLQRSIGLHLLVRPSDDPETKRGQTIALASYQYLEGIALQEYVSGGTEADSARLQQVMKQETAKVTAQFTAAEKKVKASGKPVITPPSVGGSVLDGMTAAIASGASPSELAHEGVTPQTWMAASTAKFDGYRVIEQGLVDKAVTQAGEISDNAERDAVIDGGGVLVALFVAFLLAALMARQMSRSMRALRSAAFDVAEQALPSLVDRLSRTEPGTAPGQVDTRVKPIPIDSRDEIGEIARAFDQVHREAVRLAAEQAMLRGNVNAIFTNLSRRSQSLIEGQLTLITELENRESEPEQLESLFRLDHLATRMRRNGENLLVLAGEEPGRRWNQPVPLVDVLRAAASEVESYERIELTGLPETEIHGQAVTDLVHLLAELLENATSFSSPRTKVRVTATRLPDGRMMIEIHDKGIGLTAEDFADINHRLANPPTVDAAVSQRMGLFVVGRLADRHGIKVQLRPSGEQAGTTSIVMLPDAITHGGGGQPTPEGFTVSQMIPEHRAAETNDPYAGDRMLTAAELGFDDSRYEAAPSGVDPRSLDPVGRSLMREERRAALEASSGHAAPMGSLDPAAGSRAALSGPEGPQGAFPQAPENAGGAGRAPEQGPVGDQFTNDQFTGHEQPATGPAYDGAAGGYPAYGGQEPPAPGTYPQDYGYQAGDGFAARAAQDGASGGYAQGGFPLGQSAFRAAPDAFGRNTGQDPAYPGAGTGHGDVPPDAGVPGAYRGEHVTGDYPEARLPSGPGAGAPYDGGYGEQSHQQGWQQSGTYPDEQTPQQEAESESSQVGPEIAAERVGFDRPGPSPSISHTLTDAGLPRRGTRRDAQQEWQPAGQEPGMQQVAAQPPQPQPDGHNGHDGADGSQPPGSANDDRFRRAGKLREPEAGGVTSSGLPRRVPKANLVEGAAEQSPQGGPQVSRAPEDVRGRLSNLRSGVQRGRNAGADMNGPGRGPGSTYNQER